MQTSGPKVSILLPVYNVAPWLPVCLQSVLGQTGVELEVVAVEDGSTDATPALLEARARQDSRLRVITQSNQGPAAARQTALAAAKGEFILFVDGDDCLPPGYCLQLLQTQEQTGADLVLGRVQNFQDTFAPQPGNCTGNRVLSGAGKTPLFDDFPTVMALHAKLISRGLADKISWGPFPYRNGEDIFPAVQLLVQAQRIALAPQACYGYRQGRPGSQSASPAGRFEGLFEGFLRAREFLQTSGSYALFAPGFEYVRRVCLLSFIEKYGLNATQEKLLFRHRRGLCVPRGLFKTRPFKFRLRQAVFERCLKWQISYALLARVARRLLGRR